MVNIEANIRSFQYKKIKTIKTSSFLR